MDDLNPLPRTETRCPVPECPWKYDLTRPEVKAEGSRVRLIVPPPAGEHLRAEEIAAGWAARPVLAVSQPIRVKSAGAAINGLVELVMTAAFDQDEAVTATHLASHTRAELALAFPGRGDYVVGVLTRAGYEPAA